jgi:hypothetical protein
MIHSFIHLNYLDLEKLIKNIIAKIISALTVTITS